MKKGRNIGLIKKQGWLANTQASRFRWWFIGVNVFGTIGITALF